MDAKSLDRNSPVPLYVQIEDFIRHEIAIGSVLDRKSVV